MTAKKTYTRPDTVLAVAGRDPANNFGIVNPPVYHASTILSPTMEKFENRVPFEGFGYGRNGTPTQKALEDAVAAIEGAQRSIAVQSGLAAVTGAMVGFLKTGDHMLLTDNAYGPARRFANTTLKNFGVETTFFDPMIGAGIEKLIRPNTKVVYLEAPGSQTFEVQDVDAIAKVAKKHSCAVLIDNTWPTPLCFKVSSGSFSFPWRDGNSRGGPAAMLDGMEIFGMGASWGGYESLMIPAHPGNYRTAVPWPDSKRILRVHIGLEDVEDLKTDLAEGFDRLNRAHNA